MRMSPITFIVLPRVLKTITPERSDLNMLTDQMTHVKSTNARPRKTVCYMTILASLMLFAFGSALKGQSAKSPSSKAQTDLRSSAASVRVAQPENDWRAEVTHNASAPVTIIEFFDYQCPFCLKTNPALAE